LRLRASELRAYEEELDCLKGLDAMCPMYPECELYIDNAIQNAEQVRDEIISGKYFKPEAFK
jgi:hypothetical protein